MFTLRRRLTQQRLVTGLDNVHALVNEDSLPTPGPAKPTADSHEELAMAGNQQDAKRADAAVASSKRKVCNCAACKKRPFAHNSTVHPMRDLCCYKQGLHLMCGSIPKRCTL